jgi:hypothetical protein
MLVTAVLATPVGALCGEAPPPCRDQVLGEQDAAMACMGALDRDGDGALSPQEARVLPRISGRFAELDTDGNGLLGPGEFQGGLVSPAERAGALGH